VTLALRPFEPRDDRELISWFPDPDDLRRFAGPSLSWPLDRAQLRAVRNAANLVPFSAYIPPVREPACGHVELVVLAEQGVVRLARVGLAPRVRGRGLGRELLTLAFEESRARGAREIELFVFEDNVPARRLYASFGFERVGVDPTDASSLRMRVALPSPRDVAAGGDRRV